MHAFKVRYEKGVFRPLQKTEAIDEGTIAEVRIQGKNGRPSVRSSAFFGLWKNRKGMKDSVSYVRKLRSQTRY